jgi:hypothetical protein
VYLAFIYRHIAVDALSLKGAVSYTTFRSMRGGPVGSSMLEMAHAENANGLGYLDA